MRFYDFISDNRPVEFNGHNIQGGLLTPPDFFDKQIWVCFSCVYFFLAFSCIFFALDEQQQQNESLIRSFWVKPIGENVYVGVDLSRAVPSALPAECDAYMYYMRGRLLIKSCMPYTSMLRWLTKQQRTQLHSWHLFLVFWAKAEKKLIDVIWKQSEKTMTNL